MTRVDATKARQDFAETLNQVAYRDERVVISRRGKDLAAIVPIEDLELLEELENHLDIQAAKQALTQARRKGEKPIPWARAKKMLGL